MMQRTQPAIAPVVDTSPRVVIDPVRDGGGLEIGRKTYVPTSRNSFSLLKDVRVVGVLLVAGEALLLIGIVLLWLVATVLVLRWVA